MNTPINEVEAAIKRFPGVAWSASGCPIPCERGESIEAGWVEFGLQQSALGWRTLEFLAWTYTEMIRAGERLKSPKPHSAASDTQTISESFRA